MARNPNRPRHMGLSRPPRRGHAGGSKHGRATRSPRRRDSTIGFSAGRAAGAGIKALGGTMRLHWGTRVLGRTGVAFLFVLATLGWHTALDVASARSASVDPPVVPPAAS